MAKTISQNLAFYYDEEIFNNAWMSEPDPTSVVLLESGAMVEDSLIANLIANGSNYYALPYYVDIDGDEVNYDGATDIPDDQPNASGVLNGVVWGRAKEWQAVTFVKDFTTADPMRNILNRVQIDLLWQQIYDLIRRRNTDCKDIEERKNVTDNQNRCNNINDDLKNFLIIERQQCCG